MTRVAVPARPCIFCIRRHPEKKKRRTCHDYSSCQPAQHCERSHRLRRIARLRHRRRRSARPRREIGEYRRGGQLFTRGRRRMDIRDAQSAADHRGQGLGGCGCARRASDRLACGPPRQPDQRYDSQPRRSCGAVSVGAGHAQRARAAHRSGSDNRDRHAAARVLATAARRLSDRRRSIERGDDRGGQKRRRRGLWRRRGVCHQRSPVVSLRRFGPSRLSVRRAATARCVRQLGARPRSAPGQSRRRPLCLAGRHRLLRPRRLWNLECGRGLWQRLGADLGGERLGAVSPWTLDLDRAVGLDLGRRCTLGFRAFSLRSLGLRAPALVLGAGPAPRATGLRAGAGRLCRRQ